MSPKLPIRLAVLGVVLVSASVANAGIVIIDDHDVGEQGTGTFSITDTSKPRAKTGMYHPGGSGNGCYLMGNTVGAIWTPTLTAGTWLVEVWNPTNAQSIVSNTTTVVHANGSTAYPFKQTDAGGHWAALGFHAFNAGTGGYVTIANATLYAYADAVRFSDAAEQIVANFTFGQTFAYTEDTDWGPAKFGGDHISDDDDAAFAWNINIVPGMYNLDFNYMVATNRDDDTIVQVWDGATQLGSDIYVNQRDVNVPAEAPVPGSTDLGNFTFSGYTATVKVIVNDGDPRYASAKSLDMSIVPEPATLALMALGGAGLLALRRRRR